MEFVWWINCWIDDDDDEGWLLFHEVAGRMFS